MKKFFTLTRADVPAVVLSLLLNLLAVGVALLLAGCGGHPRAVAFKSLDTLRISVDRAERLYGDAVAAGQISEARQVKIDEKISEFHAAYLVAVRAARFDYNTPAGADLDKLAGALIDLIYAYAKEPAP
jgi:uncharacterized lipoprotein YmbA